MANFHIDDNAIMELVCATHNPDGTNFNENVVLGAIEKILNFEKATDEEAIEDMIEAFDLNFRELSLKIQHLCFERTSNKSSSIIDGHLITICLLSTLSVYSWEAKMVLMLAAFSIISYEKLNIFSRLRYRKGLAKQLGIITKITNSTSSNDPNPIDDLIKCAMDLTKCIVEINQSSSYSLSQSVVISALPMASYWIGRSIACIVAYCACLPLTNIKIDSELNIITTKIKDILTTCSPALEAKRAEESYQALQQALFNNSSDKLEVLRLILNVIDDDEISLSREKYDRRLVVKVGLDYLDEDKKVALLLTSGLDISNERIQFLNAFHRASTATYILWIPIVDDHAVWSTEQYKEFRDKMSFQILDDPHKRISRNFVRFVKENLLPHFQIGDEPILVSLDQQGRIVHTNAMHMIQTWMPYYIEDTELRVLAGNNIIPFIEKEMKERSQGLDSLISNINEQISHLAREVDYKIKAWARQINNRIYELREQSNMYTSERENALWKKEKDWSLDLAFGEEYWISDGEYIFFHHISEETYIFFFGGNDIKWVREFTSKVHEVSLKTQSSIGLIYLGKSEIISASIAEEGMSIVFKRPYYAWRFWTRLQSALLSRINYLNAINCYGDDCDDEIAQGFKKLLGYECKGKSMEGWALLSKGQKVVVCGRGAKMLRVINEYESWKENLALKSFDEAFKDYYNKTLHACCSSNSNSCCAFEYPITLKEIPKKEKCPRCYRDMQKLVTFTCYHGDN